MLREATNLIAERAISMENTELHQSKKVIFIIIIHCFIYFLSLENIIHG